LTVAVAIIIVDRTNVSFASSRAVPVCGVLQRCRHRHKSFNLTILSNLPQG